MQRLARNSSTQLHIQHSARQQQKLCGSLRRAPFTLAPAAMLSCAAAGAEQVGRVTQVQCNHCVNTAMQHSAQNQQEPRPSFQGAPFIGEYPCARRTVPRCSGCHTTAHPSLHAYSTVHRRGASKELDQPMCHTVPRCGGWHSTAGWSDTLAM
jgi:hypothetical protein